MTHARCPACDRPLATQADYDATGEGERTDLCWRAWNNDRCMHQPVDWRARALAAEQRIAELETARRLLAISDNTKET